MDQVDIRVTQAAFTNRNKKILNIKNCFVGKEDCNVDSAYNNENSTSVAVK